MSWFFLQIKALELNFLIRPNSHNFGTVRNCFVLQELFVWFWCFSNCLLRSFWSFEWLLMCGYYCLLTIDWPECDEWNYQDFWVRIIFINSTGKFTLWSYPFHTQFLCISFTLKHCMSRIDNMWVLGSSWWGRNLLPCIQTFGVTITLCLYCHAMLVDVDWVWEYFMTNVRLLINGST